MAVGAIEAVLASPPALMTIGASGAVARPAGAGFAEFLAASVHKVDGKLAAADDLVRRFTLDDGVPIHQVTYALAEARLSVEVAMQVRGRMLDGYRELMNMQL